VVVWGDNGETKPNKQTMDLVLWKEMMQLLPHPHGSPAHASAGGGEGENTRHLRDACILPFSMAATAIATVIPVWLHHVHRCCRTETLTLRQPEHQTSTLLLPRITLTAPVASATAP
jgi:hypothetical protein